MQNTMKGRLEGLGFWDVRSSATYLSVVPERLPGQVLSTRGLKERVHRVFECREVVAYSISLDESFRGQGYARRLDWCVG